MSSLEESTVQEGQTEGESSVTEEVTAENRESEIMAKISQEQERAREDFGELIDSVSERYQDMAPEMKKTFIAHNQEILEAVVELGVKKGLTPEELKLAEIAAIIHDMAKAEPDPEGVGNHTLANHGEAAAQEVNEVVTEEILEKTGVKVDDPSAVQAARDTIAAVVREHMGPHPGFMDSILAGVNAQIEAKNAGATDAEPLPLVEHPTAKGRVSETLLAADMGSLAGRAGREKVMAIRSNVPFFSGQDQAAVVDYKVYGVTLTQGEAALLSGFDSADDACKMLSDPGDRARTQALIDQSKEEPYAFNNSDGEGEQVTWLEATQKRVEFLPQWIAAEEGKIAGGEYNGVGEIEAAGKRVEQARRTLERSQQELETHRRTH